MADGKIADVKEREERNGSVIPPPAVPVGAVPVGAVPVGAVPVGAVPVGAVPVGAVPVEKRLYRFVREVDAVPRYFLSSFVPSDMDVSVLTQPNEPIVGYRGMNIVTPAEMERVRAELQAVRNLAYRTRMLEIVGGVRVECFELNDLFPIYRPVISGLLSKLNAMAILV